MAGVFREEDYREMLRLLPPAGLYAELRHNDARMPDGTYARLEFLLTDDNLARLDPAGRRLWRECARALRQADVHDALAGRLGEDPTGARRRTEARTSLRLSLLRDLPGYFIRPHRDIPRKVLTAQFYLPADDRGAALGTQFYRRAPGGALERAATVPHLPNTGCAFPVTADSWHGVDPVPEGAPPRDSLMLIWYLAGPAAGLRTGARRASRWLRSVGIGRRAS